MKNQTVISTICCFLGGVLFLFLVCVSGCNEELGPVNSPSGFAGVIHFKNWPAATAIKEMRLVALAEIPRDSTGVIPALLAGKAAVYPPVPGDYFQVLVDSIVYEFTDKSGTNLQVMEYPYLAVWYQYGNNILHDWRPAGVYSTSPDGVTPAPVRVVLHHVTPGINISVDFNNLPPLPWQ